VGNFSEQNWGDSAERHHVTSAAFVTSARGIAPVGGIDDIAIGVDPDLMAALRTAQESVGWDLI
jgi:hypothetical protein